MEKNVLLIDDEAGLRRSVSVGLMQKGYHTEPCESGMKGLETLETLKKRQMPLECAIVDVRLPDIDGFKLLKVIKSYYPDLPVVMITGYGNEEIAQEAKNQMADAYLEKPLTMEDLTKVLAKIPATQPAADSGVATQAKPELKTSVTAYALLSLDENADFLKIYRNLYFNENILYCDAIRGEHDMVLLLQSDTHDAIKSVVDTEIKAIPGVSDVTLLNVEVPMFGENVHSIINSVDKALGRDKAAVDDVSTGQIARKRVSSYVLLEIEKEKLEAIYPALYFNDQVVSCDYIVGKYDIILLMKGSSFSEIENTIRTKFKTLDGVLRIKEWPILTLFEA